MVFAQWFSDPIGSMNGPTFLVFYTALVIAGVMAVRWRVVSGNDEANLRPALRMPKTIDPYQVAFLRGGDSEVLRVAMVDLVDRGVINRIETTCGGIVKVKLTKWVTDQDRIQGERFTEIQKYLIERFRTEQDATSIFEKTEMSKVRRMMDEYREWVRSEQLLNDHSNRYSVGSMAWKMIVGLELLGLYKLIAALSHRQFNVMFLVFHMALVIPLLFSAIAYRKRLTKRGKQFLKDVQSSYRSLRSLKVVESQKRRDVRILASGSTAPLLAMGVFGVSALQGSSLDPMYQSYQRSVANIGGCGAISGGCGSGCGASVIGMASCGSAGGGCGGAGAGCGGGGCGGGGCGGCGGG